MTDHPLHELTLGLLFRYLRGVLGVLLSRRRLDDLCSCFELKEANKKKETTIAKEIQRAEILHLIAFASVFAPLATSALGASHEWKTAMEAQEA